eukprot:GILI01003795.1.p1 GENE.GILI01003795.1~~GILI01003795.1.p1  ORF type:complete len:753 (+),score=167.08 GILI01003795.1:119-2377(+)
MPSSTSTFQLDLSKLKNVPSLPGYQMDSPSLNPSYRKSQRFSFREGVPIEVKEGLTTREKPKLVPTPRDCFENKGHNWQKVEMRTVPSWVAHDRKVLRFPCYFKESVYESSRETFRVRKCTIFYYLEDDTMHIEEHKQDNSGISQGIFVKRHKFPKSQGGTYLWSDIRVGSDIVVYGRTFHITDCDSFTRTWFEQNNIDIGQPDEVPEDPYRTYRSHLEHKTIKLPLDESKKYVESMLGASTKNQNLKQFLDNDRKVLRFFATSFDGASHLPFTFDFFLADDTVEVRERYGFNSGRGNFPVFLRRQRLVKSLRPKLGPGLNDPAQEEYYRPTDLNCSITVSVLNRQFRLHACDEFTRRYLTDLGVTVNPDENADPSGELSRSMRPGKSTVVVPPYNGFGAPEDSLGSVYHLVPKAPRRDVKKLLELSDLVLRYRIKFTSPKPEEVNRTFILIFYLADDTISIYEPFVRNSGLPHGNYLNRCKLVNPSTGLPFTPADLVIGSSVNILNQSYDILEADQHSQKILTHGVKAVTAKADRSLDEIVAQLRNKLHDKRVLIRKTFRDYDRDHNGLISMGELRAILHQFGFELSDSELLVLMRKYDSDGNGTITYTEFCNEVLEPDYGARASMLDRKRGGEVDLSVANDSEYAALSARAEYQLVEREKIRKTLRSFCDVFLRHSKLLTKAFRDLDINKNTLISRAEVIAVLRRLGYAWSDEEMSHITSEFFDGESEHEGFNYEQFMLKMTSMSSQFDR